MNRISTARRRNPPQSVLQVRVMSPRIAWFGFLKLMGKLVKFGCVLAVLIGVGWGVWRGIRHVFYENPEFRLQALDLNANPVIDELGVAAAAGIDLTKDPSLFEIDVNEVARRLKEMPEIRDARAERHLPGTLLVRVIPRTPKAWVRCPKAGFAEVRKAGALLVDPNGYAYPCPQRLVASAMALPIIDLPASEAHSIQPGIVLEQPELEVCFRLLDAACRADPAALQWIDSVTPANAWSLVLVTRGGTAATFGLDDHERQIAALRAALDHAGEKGYSIETINLIPRYNVPITVRGQALPPKAIPVMAEEAAAETDRRARDLDNLLQRN